MSFGRTFARWVVDHGYEAAEKTAMDAIRSGKLSGAQLSIRDQAESMLGHNWAVKLKSIVNSPFNPRTLALSRSYEAADAIDPSVFASITGNQLIDTVKDKYKSPEFIGDQLVRTIPNAHGNLDEFRVPNLSNVLSAQGLFDLDDVDEDIVNPGMPIGRSEFLPNYYAAARPKKRAIRVDVTWEAIYTDRTSQIQDSAGSVGRRLGLSKEYRILKVFLGIVPNYKYVIGNNAEVSSATYVTTNAAGDRWVNALNSNTLTDWSNLNTVEQLFNQMRDPVTGEPIDIEANKLFVMPSRLMTAKHILHSTGIRVGASQTATTLTYSSSELKPYELMTSKYAYKLASTASMAWPSQDYFTASTGATTLTMTAAQANDLWIVGDPQKALYYREVYPLMVEQAPPNNPDAFGKDIVLSIKAEEFGVAGVADPRYLVRSLGHSFESQTD